MKSGEHPSSPTHPLIWGGFWPQSPAPPSPPHLLQLDVMEKNAILGDISSSQAASSSASPPRAKARCFRSVRRGPSEAVCEITCLERKFLQLAAGSCPSLGWLQRSHPFRIYLFLKKKSSPMGLGRGRGLVSGPYRRSPFSSASSEASRAEISVRSFPRLLPPVALSRCQPWERSWGSPETRGARSGQLFPGLGSPAPTPPAGICFWRCCARSSPRTGRPYLGFSPFLPPPFCLFIPFPGKIFPPRAGEIQWLSAASIVGPGMSWHAGLPVRKPDVAAGALRRTSPGPAGWDQR